MSKINEALKDIQDCEEMIKPYEGYAPVVTDSLRDLDAIRSLLSKPSATNLEKALKKVKVLKEKAEPYRSYVPRLPDLLDAITEKLTKAKEIIE